MHGWLVWNARAPLERLNSIVRQGMALVSNHVYRRLLLQRQSGARGRGSWTRAACKRGHVASNNGTCILGHP
jgi:hypothetical protein